MKKINYFKDKEGYEIKAKYGDGDEGSFFSMIIFWSLIIIPTFICIIKEI